MTDAERRSRIGASMAPAVLNMSPYENGTPLGAYLYFTGQLPEQEETPEMEWGTRLEEMIRVEASDHFSRFIFQKFPRLHPDYPFMGASPDGVFDGDPPRGLEIKNVTDAARAREWKEPGTDFVPDHVMIQVQHQMAVFGFAAVEVAACLFGRPPVYYHVERSDVFIDHLVRVLSDFWIRVQERRPPEPDWSHPDTPKLVELLRRPTAGKTIELDAFAAEIAAGYEELGEAIRNYDKVRGEFRARLIDALGDAQFGLLPDGRRLRRRLVKALPPAMSKGRREYYQLDILKGE